MWTFSAALGIGLVWAGLLLAQEARPGAEGAPAGGTSLVDYVDPTYGGKIRQLLKPDGHEHNLYYYRDPWNADGSFMVAVQSDLQQKNWRVALYDGEGRFIRELFSIDKFDWRLCWDRKDPAILYTWRGSELYRYNVTTGNAELLKSFAPLGLKPNGPSLNQDGDRILIVTSDGAFRSYRLPDMVEERTFKLTAPPGCHVDWGKPRYIGCRNYIDTAYRATDLSQQAIVVYDDTGAVVHKFEGKGGGGHYDLSCEGELAYFKMPVRQRGGGAGTPLEIRVVNLDGSDDRVLFSVSEDKTRYLQNLHVNWPDKVSDWFVASFFPSAGNLPPKYEPPLDEILLLKTDGTHRYLARTGTAHSRAGGRGQTGDMFWAQPLASPSSDGRRILFNSIRSGTIDLHILFLSSH